VFDNHIHLRASHRGVDAAKDFERAGGTAFLLTHSPYDEVPIRAGRDFERAYELTLRMADAVRAATSIRVFVALGPYPVEIVRLADALGLEAAADAGWQGVETAGRHIAEGRAVAFGEVGRPHFPVPPETWRACNELLAATMREAARLGCAVVIHSEDPVPETFAEFAGMAARAGMPAERVVKHHSAPLVRPDVTRGIVPSILAKEDLVAKALEGGGRFLLETDYIDDPKRPGAVLGPATVPRKTRAWLERGLLTQDRATLVHKELPERTYGIEIPG
jgi:TatD-related deoxyribonuclease